MKRWHHKLVTGDSMQTLTCCGSSFDQWWTYSDILMYVKLCFLHFYFMILWLSLKQPKIVTVFVFFYHYSIFFFSMVPICNKMHYCLWLILRNNFLISVDEVTLKCYWILFFQKQPIRNEVMNTERRKRSRSTKHSREKHSRHSAFNFPFRQSHNQQKECLGF